MDAKKAMCEAIILLLEDNQIQNVTANMIMQKADVSRATFYKYYRDKYDLMSEIYRIYMKKYCIPEQDFVFKEHCVRTLKFFKKYNKFFSNVFRSEGQNAHDETIRQHSFELFGRLLMQRHDIGEMSDYDKLALEFYVAGAIKVTKLWLIHGNKETVEEIAQIMCDCIPDPLKKYVN